MAAVFCHLEDEIAADLVKIVMIRVKNEPALIEFVKIESRPALGVSKQ